MFKIISKIISIAIMLGIITACQATKLSIDNYKVSCGRIISKDSLVKTGSTFVFKIKKGEIGGCPTDRKGYKDANVQFDHSERQEVTWPIKAGVTTFKADFKADGNTIAYRNSIFQIHDGRDPLFMAHYNKHMRMRYLEKRDNKLRWTNMYKYGIEPGKTYPIKAVIKRQKGKVDLKFYFNGEMFTHLEDLKYRANNSPYPGAPYIKIGIYRIIAEGTVTQTYSNTSLSHEEITNELESTWADDFPPPPLLNSYGILYDPSVLQTCKTIGNSIKPVRDNLLRYSKLRKLRGSTIIRTDANGRYAVYINKNLITLGFRLDDAGNVTQNWDIGKVELKNNRFCQTWENWDNGSNESEKCWQVHEEIKQLYFFCSNPIKQDGSAVIVNKGNVYGAKLSGSYNCSSHSDSGLKPIADCSIEFSEIP